MAFDLSTAKFEPASSSPQPSAFDLSTATFEPESSPSPPITLDGVWKGVKTTASNIPRSAVNFYGSLVDMVLNPVDTATMLGKLAQGEALLATGLDYAEQPEKAKSIELARSLNSMYRERYGGWDNFVKTIQTDPVGAMADISTVLSGGAGALRATGAAAGAAGATGAAGKLSQAGAVLTKASQVTDPLRPAAKLVSPVIRGAYNFAEPYIVPGGETAVFNRALREIGLFNDVLDRSGRQRINPDRMNEIASRAAAGQSIDQIATEMNLPTLAWAAREAEFMGGGAIQKKFYEDPALAQRRAQANQLAGAEQAVNQEIGSVNALSDFSVNLRQTALEDAKRAAGEQLSPNTLLQLEGARQAAGRLSSELEQTRMAEAGTLPKTMPEQQGQVLTDMIDRRKTNVTKSQVDPLYDSARNLAAGVKTDVSDIFNVAAQAMGTPLAKFSPDMLPAATAAILNRFQGKATTTGTGPMGLTGRSTTFETPMAAMDDLIDLRKALNADYARTIRASTDPAQATKLAALAKMQEAIDGVIANSTTFPPDAIKAADDARAAYKTLIGDVYKSGDESRKLLTGNMRPDALVPTFFSSGNLDATQQMARMVKEDPAARAQLQLAVENFYRKQVVKNNIIDPTAHARFMSKYEDNMRILKDAGVDFTNINLRTLPATVYPRMAADISETTSQIQKLQDKLGPTPQAPVPTIQGDLSTVRKTVAEVEAEIASRKAASVEDVADRARDLEQAKQAAKVATADLDKVNADISALRERLNIPEKETVADIVADVPEAKNIVDQVQTALYHQTTAAALAETGAKLKMPLWEKYRNVKIPVGIGTEIIVNNTVAELSKNVNARLAQRLALAMIDSKALAEAMQKAAKGNLTQRAVDVTAKTAGAVNKLAPGAVNINALLNSQTANGVP
jgi:hypothetical protein